MYEGSPRPGDEALQPSAGLRRLIMFQSPLPHTPNVADEALRPALQRSSCGTRRGLPWKPMG